MGVALITGASSGLGLEFAELFAKDKHSLILVARRKDLMEKAAAKLKLEHPEIQIEIFAMDLGVPGAGRILHDKVKARGLGVNFLVNNAGFGSNGEFLAQPIDQELQMIDLNVRTLVELTHCFLPDMTSAKAGRILNIGSTAGFQPGPFMATYYASKAFVNSFSEALHDELLGTGVTCSLLAPGATATGFARASGNENSRLFNRGSVANSRDVAKLGYRAMLAGRAVAVPGFLNNLAVQALRISPRFLVRKIAAFLNKNA